MLWNKIKNQLKKQNMTIYHLSKLTGIAQTTFQNYKNGSEPSFENMVKIADALGVSLDEFRGDKGNG